MAILFLALALAVRRAIFRPAASENSWRRHTWARRKERLCPLYRFCAIVGPARQRVDPKLFDAVPRHVALSSGKDRGRRLFLYPHSCRPFERFTGPACQSTPTRLRHGSRTLSVQDNRALDFARTSAPPFVPSRHCPPL